MYVYEKTSFKVNILHTGLFANLKQEYGVFLFTSMQLQVFVYILYYIADT